MKKEKITDKIKYFFFPAKCISCGKIIADRQYSKIFCEDCFLRLCEERSSRCSKCGKPYSICNCRPADFSADGLCYAFPYVSNMEVSKKLILFCKSNSREDVYDFISDMMLGKAKNNNFLPDDPLITFVPRSSAKKFKFGVDQSEMLARSVSKKSGIECVHLLKHKSFSKEQKKLSALSRKENAGNSYVFNCKNRSIDGRNIILIDDIITTGSTLDSCSDILHKNGAGRVVCLCASRRDSHEKPVV